MFALVSYMNSSFGTDASGRLISEEMYTIIGDTLGDTSTVKSKYARSHFFCCVAALCPSALTSKKGRWGCRVGVGGLFYACAAGIVKLGSNLKINCEYLLGATFACDTLSCVPSQFSGTARVCHSSLS